jgi:IS30 family transposase
MVMISERPAEVEDRAVPGHLEGDLIIGKDHQSAVCTLVERTTRFVRLLHLWAGKDAATVNEAMQKEITTLLDQLVKTITWDQGSEMGRHVDFTVETGTPIYFCDPHSPWQRGRTETPTDFSANTCPRAPTCRSIPSRTSTL